MLTTLYLILFYALAVWLGAGCFEAMGLRNAQRSPAWYRRPLWDRVMRNGTAYSVMVLIGGYWFFTERIFVEKPEPMKVVTGFDDEEV